VWDAAAANRVTHLLANSRLTSDRIAATYGRASEVLHPPVEVDPFLALPRDPQGYALYVGELVQYKRVDLTIETAKRLHVPLLIAGDGPERSALEKQAAGADIHFFGRVSDEFRNALLTGASFFLYGGIEDFGIVFVEAMAAGIPIVGPKAGGLLDIGEMGGVAFAESQEIDDLVAAAERCLAAPAAYSDRSAAARFSTSTFRSKFISIAEDLVAV
jgi:glycosyltransferase involved in cell wall biosynthesis